MHLVKIMQECCYVVVDAVQGNTLFSSFYRFHEQIFIDGFHKVIDRAVVQSLQSIFVKRSDKNDLKIYLSKLCQQVEAIFAR